MTTPKRNEAVAPVAWMKTIVHRSGTRKLTRFFLALSDASRYRVYGYKQERPPVALVPASELDALQGEVSRLREVLRVLADANFAEFCDEATEEMEPDDSKVRYPEDTCEITFGMIRNARKALAKVTP